MDHNEMKEKRESIQSKKRIVRYDENGNPIPRKKRPVRYDENGNPIPMKKRTQSGKIDRPIPLRREEESKERIQNVRVIEEVTAKSPVERRKRSQNERTADLKEKKGNYAGIVIGALQAIVSIVFFVVLLTLDMLPVKYLVVIGIILAVLLGFTVLSQFARTGRKVGWVFGAIMILLFGIASIYIWKTHDVIDKVTQTEVPTTKLSDVSIVVLADSTYDGLDDLVGKDFGIQKVIDRENTDLTLKDLEGKLNYHFTTVEYESWKAQAQALYDQEVDAIVINELYRSLILEDFEDFDEDTKVLEGFTYEKEVEQKSESSKLDIKVDTEPFNIYLSGHDAYGKVTLDEGRSDVNIIATVNPKTKQILLTTTPRDFYVELPLYGGGYYDKLTHAGLLGIDTSIETLEMLYQIEIDYYVRLNFSGFRDIVDALGGVEVYSEHEFYSVKGVYFSEGLNYLNGKEALAFVRERKAFAEGDVQRGKNQMAMIEALADKIFSPAILTNYLDLMDSVSTCFVTDMPRNKINDLVKMQLNDGAEWTIISNSVKGYGNARSTYSGGAEPLYCVDPDVGDVALATELIQKCMNGEKVVIPDKEAEGIYQGTKTGYFGQSVESEESSQAIMESGVTSEVIVDSGIITDPNAGITDSGITMDPNVGIADSGATGGESNVTGTETMTPETSTIPMDSGVAGEETGSGDSSDAGTGEAIGTESSETVMEPTQSDPVVEDPGAENTGSVVQ